MLHDGKFMIKLGIPGGDAFPTDPPPEKYDIFYREDLSKLFIYIEDWEEIAGGDGAATFLDLTDTPGSYVGEGGKNVRVNAGEDALEFVDPGAPGLHAETHEDEGVDEINVAGLSGELADIQKVEIQEDDEKVADATIVNFEGGGGKVTDEGGGKVTVDITPGGDGGAADFTRWEPDAPPTAPSAYDDEFDDLSLNVKWTEFDPGAFLTVSEGEVGLILDMVTDAGADWAGIYQAIPAGDFTIVARISLMGIKADNAYAALLLWQDAGDTAKGLYSLSVFYNSAGGMQVHLARWNTWQSWDSNLVVLGTGNSTMYLRIRRTNTTYAFDVSSGGVGWYRLSSGALAFVPSHFGIGMNNEGTGVTIRGIGHFFRYKNSDVGIAGILEGDRIDGWRA